MVNPPRPLGGPAGRSKIVDAQGRVLAAAAAGESMAAYADLDIAGLRRRRLRPGMGHVLSRLPQAGISAGLGATALKPNALLDGDTLKIPQRADFAARQKATIEALLGAGVLGHD